MSRRHPAYCRYGFTLVEMVIVVLIMGILTAAVAPKFSASLRRTQLDGACKKLKADLTLARQRAIAKSSSQTVQFPTNTNSYTLVGIAHPDHPSQAHTVNLGQDPFKVAILSAVVGGDQNLVFDRFGRPDSSATITLGIGASTGTVSVNAQTGIASVP